MAMNIDTGDTPLVLLCPAWKTWGTATTVKPNTVILHSRADATVPFGDPEGLMRNSGLPLESLIEVGTVTRYQRAIGSLAHFFARLQIPQLDCLVPNRRRQCLAIWAKGYG